MNEYHLRLKSTLEDAPHFIELFEKWRGDDILNLVCSHEFGKVKDEPHIHMYLSLSKKMTKSTISTWMIKKGYSRMYSFSDQRKTTVNHLAYIIKDGNILKSTIDPELMKEAEGVKIEIQSDQKRSTIQKIYNYVDDNKLDTATPFKCMRIVFNYFRTLKKIPHTRHILQYYGNDLYINYNDRDVDVYLELC